MPSFSLGIHFNFCTRHALNHKSSASSHVTIEMWSLAYRTCNKCAIRLCHIICVTSDHFSKEVLRQDVTWLRFILYAIYLYYLACGMRPRPPNVPENTPDSINNTSAHVLQSRWTTPMVRCIYKLKLTSAATRNEATGNIVLAQVRSLLRYVDRRHFDAGHTMLIETGNNNTSRD